MTKRPNAGATAPSEGAAVLTADCPWTHRDKLGERGAAAKYETMTTEAICKLELPPLAERNVLFLWRLSNMPQDALDVCDAWGFEPVSEVVWEKLRPCQVCCATGRVDSFQIGDKPAVLVPGEDNRCPACRGSRGVQIHDEDLGTFPAYMGLGRSVRNAHETAIIARSKKTTAPERLNKDVRSYFAAPMLIDVDGVLPESNGRRGALVHSAKPDEFVALVQRIYGGPYVEMFSRRTRAGWSQAYSDQDDKLDQVAHTFKVEWPQRERAARLAKARR